MLTRPVRRAVALFAVVGIVFAQMAVVAYACPVQGSASPPTIAPHAVADDTSQHPCGGAAPQPVVPQTVACEVHCTDGATLPATPDLPPVVLTALPVPVTPPEVLAMSDASARTPTSALPGAPPPSLLFCRLLI